MGALKTICAATLSALALTAAASSPMPLIPKPHVCDYTGGDVALAVPLRVAQLEADSASVTIISRMASVMDSLLVPGSQEGAVLSFVTDAALPDEGYVLTATPDTVRIAAKGRAGYFYGLQTLRRLLGAEMTAGKAGASNVLPAVHIEDSPRFAFRAMMLDVSRHFFTADEVKRVLDLMAEYKLNRFQWHLTDDQGWRMPVAEYPLLTTVGATHPANTRMTDFTTQTQTRTSAPLGPFAYTEEEIRSVVNHARDLNIEIIPEIEMPGHMAAAIAAYPWLSCRPDSIDGVRDLEGISKDVLDISSPCTMAFVRTVLDRTMELFPYPMIHIGGDEAPTAEWQRHAGCRALADSLGLEGADAEQRFRKLQNHFTAAVNDYCREHGRQLMTWDEIVTAPGADIAAAQAVNPVVTAYDIVWDKPVEQCDTLGLQCVYSPFGPYYVNRRYSTDRIGAGNGRDDPEAVYRHPVPGNANVLGLQATFWTEWVCNMRDLEYLALPRLAAVAESAWSNGDDKDFDDWAKRIAAERTWLDMDGRCYGPLMPGKE